MQAIINKEQQNALWRVQANLRLSRTELKNVIGIDALTLRRILDRDAPIIVRGKTFAKVNDFLIERLEKY